MSHHDTKDIQVKEKKEVPTIPEQTKSGRSFIPDVDIYETEKDIIMLADIPGVKGNDLDIDLKDNILTISADVKSQAKEDETLIYSEYRTGRYYRKFTLSEVIEQSKIDAKLNDGILTLTLPKVEKAAARKITVTAT
ncbi:MAG: Hsp20/alpha crystallin family protein [Desulfobacterales bacterium]|nr:Hsp20/alpha crystallin family protein [Desulfobacterales bacterium]